MAGILLPKFMTSFENFPQPENLVRKMWPAVAKRMKSATVRNGRIEIKMSEEIPMIGTPYVEMGWVTIGSSELDVVPTGPVLFLDVYGTANSHSEEDWNAHRAFVSEVRETAHFAAKVR